MAWKALRTDTFEEGQSQLVMRAAAVGMAAPEEYSPRRPGCAGMSRADLNPPDNAPSVA